MASKTFPVGPYVSMSVDECAAMSDEIVRLRAALAAVTAERDAARADVAKHEALVAELREMSDECGGFGQPETMAHHLLARHGLGGDA